MIIKVTQGDFNGALFGRDKPLQSAAAIRLPREVRAVVFRTDTDIDMVDAMARIMGDWLVHHNCLDEYPTFKNRLNTRDKKDGT